VLDEFLAGTIALNTFSALTLVDTVNGETLTWPAKIGRFRLL
jgi:type VI secretion system protein ImpG